MNGYHSSEYKKHFFKGILEEMKEKENAATKRDLFMIFYDLHGIFMSDG